MLEDLFQPMHLVVILAVVLLLFGPSKLPELGSALGKTVRGFKDAVNGSPREAGGDEAPKQIEGRKG